jgi:UDP-N-acetylglucosamine--N-acetylmuramyl-(pentapeptide) pyrophosphoryl-undecaprenol N-acetylglucosamine transferase
VRVVVAAGGTAGHVNPALALAAALEGDEVRFVGTTVGAEAVLVPRAGWPLETIEVRGFDRARPASFVATAVIAARAITTVLALLRRLRPDVVVGMGGYVSLPVCVAARALGIPIVVHEQNIVLGLANDLCRLFARAVAVSFPDTLKTAGPRAVLVGDPIAPEIAHADHAAERRRGLRRFGLSEDRRTLLVFGGSQGAQRVNTAAAELAHRWRARGDRQIVHITGPAYDGAPPEAGSLVYRAVPFVDRMIEAYAVADLALCRGGATTVAEIASVGLPAVIVPYPFHRDRQQELHGRVLERAGAAVVIDDAEATGARVGAEADRLLAQGSMLEAMSRAARSLGVPDAAERLAAVVKEAAA